MRIDVPIEGLEQLVATLGYDDAKNVLSGRAFSVVMNIIDAEMKRYAERSEARHTNRIAGSPASAHNQQRPLEPPPPIEQDLNYFAPTKRLQEMLCLEWFDKVSKDKMKYTQEWREQLIADLMASEHSKEIAQQWSKKELRLQLRGHVIGALIDAGVFNKKALAIARFYYGTGTENTTKVKTFARYMGDSKKTYFADWIIEYVKQS